MNVQHQIRRAAKLNLLALDLADAHRYSEPEQKARAWALIRRCDQRCDKISLAVVRYTNRSPAQISERVLDAQDEIMMNRRQKPAYIKAA